MEVCELLHERARLRLHSCLERSNVRYPISPSYFAPDSAVLLIPIILSSRDVLLSYCASQKIPQIMPVM